MTGAVALYAAGHACVPAGPSCSSGMFYAELTGPFDFWFEIGY